MVLNSVTWDTELLISIDGVLTKTTIGEFTDGYMERTAGTPDLEAHPQDARHGSRTVTSASAPSTRRAAHWTQVEACTRHPVVGRRQQHGVQGDSADGAEVTVTRRACSSASATRSCTPPWTTSIGDYRPWPPPRSRTCRDLDAGPDRLGQSDEGGVHVGGGQGDRLLPQRWDVHAALRIVR
jgi:hypothetical protein